MICTNCKKGNLKEEKTTYYKKVNGSYFIVENVPCFVCDYCGEKAYSLQTLKKIERMIENMTKVEKANIVVYNEAA